MKRVFIDASLAYKHDGTGRVSYNLTKQLLNNPKNIYIILQYKKDQFPQYKENERIVKVISHWSAKGSIRAVWYLTILPYLLWKYKADIFYSYEAFSTPVLFRGRTILTIHDLIPIKIKDYYAKFLNRTWFHFRVWLSTRTPTEVVVVSTFTKQEVEEYFPLFKNHTHIVYNAIDERFIKETQNTSILEEYNLLDKGYILGIGALEKRKNNILTIKAFDAILNTHPDFPLHLAIIGMGNQAYANVQANTIEGISDTTHNRIHLLPGVSNEVLAELFSHSFMFIFPSTYEGFGMPALEAMHAGIPVIALHATSLPEVVGEAGILVENDQKQMEEAILKVYNNTALREEIIRKETEQMKKFSWEEGAREIEKIIDSINN